MNVYVSDPRYIEALKAYPTLKLTSLEDAQCVITGRYNQEKYHAPHRVVFIPFTGHNGIDIEFLKEKNLMLFNTNVHSIFVAERALALTLALLGKVTIMHEKLRGGDWSNRFDEHRVPWVTLHDKTVGIYGYGAIGQALSRYLEPLAKEIYTIDRGKNYGQTSLVPDLKTLAKTVDVLMVSAPLTEHTEQSVNAGILSELKGYLINVGRGPIVDETALYQSLKNQETLGFASDVWYHYPKDATPTPPSTFPLDTFDNVVLSPHVAGFTDLSSSMMVEDVLQTVVMIALGDHRRALDLSQLGTVPFRK